MSEQASPDWRDRYFDALRRLSLLLDGERTRVRVKPVFGATLGYGRHVLASYWSIQDGLDVVTYYLLDAKTRFVLSAADTKGDALRIGRENLQTFEQRLPAELELYAAQALAARAEKEREWAERLERRRAELPPQVKSIGRRRKQIFEESGGKCHYCETVLTLDGKWHIEHKHPRALGGGNEPGNLVASCVPCNMKKRDTTDVEFKARLQREKAA